MAIEGRYCDMFRPFIVSSVNEIWMKENVCSNDVFMQWHHNICDITTITLKLTKIKYHHDSKPFSCSWPQANALWRKLWMVFLHDITCILYCILWVLFYNRKNKILNWIELKRLRHWLYPHKKKNIYEKHSCFFSPWLESPVCSCIVVQTNICWSLLILWEWRQISARVSLRHAQCQHYTTWPEMNNNVSSKCIHYQTEEWTIHHPLCLSSKQD